MKNLVIIIIASSMLIGCTSFENEEDEVIAVPEPEEHNNYDYPLVNETKSNPDYSYRILYEYDTEAFILYFDILKENDVIYESDEVIIDKLLDDEKRYFIDTHWTVEEKIENDCISFIVEVAFHIKNSNNEDIHRTSTITENSEGSKFVLCID